MAGSLTLCCPLTWTLLFQWITHSSPFPCSPTPLLSEVLNFPPLAPLLLAFSQCLSVCHVVDDGCFHHLMKGVSVGLPWEVTSSLCNRQAFGWEVLGGDVTMSSFPGLGWGTHSTLLGLGSPNWTSSMG